LAKLRLETVEINRITETITVTWEKLAMIGDSNGKLDTNIVMQPCYKNKRLK
jgi:hypothetical protein